MTTPKTKEEVLKVILRVIDDKLGTGILFDDKDEVLGLNLGDDLGADSLDMACIGMGIEDELRIQILDEEVEGVSTVGDLLELVYEKVLNN